MNICRIAISIALMSAILILASQAIADVVELTTGERIEGVAAQATLEKVTIEVGGQTLSFDRGKVRTLHLGSAPPAVSAKPSPATEALAALKALQSVTRSGITYREYSPRVLDAGVAVDKYLTDPGSVADPARRPIELSIGFYRLMATVWNVEISKRLLDADGLAKGPLIGECSPLHDRVTSTVPVQIGNRRLPPDPGIALIMNKTMLWECASDQIREAEKVAK
jgi:hypothetical protein